MADRIGIVGAGMCGLAAAAELVAAGREVAVFDKSRGIGGRLATRRVDAMSAGSAPSGPMCGTARAGAAWG